MGTDEISLQSDQQDAEVNNETLTQSYERLRHSTDSQELNDMARRVLPDRSNAAAFSRATALLEAVAGNMHTPVEARLFLADNMPFPNVLVKLSQDPEPSVRRAVANNTASKNWLIGRLTKDDDQSVRTAALMNPQASWKMRIEGAKNPNNSPQALEFLSSVGLENQSIDTLVLAAMTRQNVALNPSTPHEIVQKLSTDSSPDVSASAQRVLKKIQNE